MIASSINFYITIFFPCEPRSNLFQEGQCEMNKYRSIIKISGTIARCNYVFIQILTFRFGTILDCVLSLMVSWMCPVWSEFILCPYSRTLTFHKKLVLIESPLKMMINAFNLILKTLFVLKIFRFLSRLFGHVGKTAGLER